MNKKNIFPYIYFLCIQLLFVSPNIFGKDIAPSEEKKPSTDFYGQCIDSAQNLEDQGYYSESLKLYFKALSIADSSNNKKRIAYSHSSLALVYFRLKEYKNTLVHLRFSEDIYLKQKQDESLAQIYLQYSMAYDAMKNNLALTYLQKARTIFETNKNCGNLANVYNSIAGYYFNEEMLDSVEYYAKQALQKYEKCGTPQEQASMYINIASLLNAQKKHEEALKYNKKGISIAKKHHILSQLLQGYKNLSETYSYMKKYEEAYNTNLIYIRYQDTIISTEKNRAIVELTQKYETKEKEKEISRQKKEIKNKENLLWMFGLFIVIVSFLAIVIFRMWQLRKKQNQILEQENATKNRLFSIISHDLKSPAIAQKAAMDSLKTEIEKIDNDLIKSYFEILHENAENQVNVITNLLNWARLQMNKIVYKPNNVDIVSIISEELRLYKVAIVQKNIHLTENISQPAIVFADRQMISIVIRNLINNAVKFTKENGHVALTCKYENNKATVTISDDGVGMKPEQISALYSSKQHIEVGFGTQGEKGTGLGLILCKELLKINNSSLNIESHLGNGTQMSFSLYKSFK